MAVIARTDALSVEGWDEAIRRARTYRDVGADMILVDGITKKEDVQIYAKELGDMPLMFAAITGQASSVSVLDAMEILGPDLTRFRLRQALELLGGTSKKEAKEWEKLLASIA